MRYLTTSLLLLCIAAWGEETVNLASLTHRLITSEDKIEGWSKYVKEVRAQQVQWEQDNQGQGSMKVFLDSKLLDSAMAAKNGDVDRLKKFARWVALYHEFSEPLPGYMQKAAERHQREIADLVTKQPSWEEIATIVKSKIKEHEDNKEREKKGPETDVKVEPAPDKVEKKSSERPIHPKTGLPIYARGELPGPEVGLYHIDPGLITETEYVVKSVTRGEEVVKSIRFEYSTKGG